MILPRLPLGIPQNFDLIQVDDFWEVSPIMFVSNANMKELLLIKSTGVVDR